MSQPESKATNYDLISRVNHWVIGITIIGLVAVGLYLEFGGLERSEKGFLMGIHKATGVLVLIFGLWRVLWRMKKGFPERAASMPNWQNLAAKASHYLLLISVILMPVSGIMYSLFYGSSIDVFGLFTIPAPEKVEWIAKLAGNIHTYSGRVLAVLILIHVVAALKHHFFVKDRTFIRMLKG